MKFFMILIALAVFISGCVGQGEQDVDGLFISYAEKSAAVDNYQVKYDTSYDISAKGESLSLAGEMLINKQGDDSYVYYSFQDPTTMASIETHLYTIGDTVYSCAWETGSPQKRCIETKNVPNLAPDPVQEREQIKALLNESIVTLKSEGRRSAAGYACDSIVIDYDLDKLKEKIPLASLGGAISFMRQSQCYELETGVPLIMKMTLRLSEGQDSAETILTTTAAAFTRVTGEITIPDDVEIVGMESSVFGNITIGE